MLPSNKIEVILQEMGKEVQQISCVCCRSSFNKDNSKVFVLFPKSVLLLFIAKRQLPNPTKFPYFTHIISNICLFSHSPFSLTIHLCITHVHIAYWLDAISKGPKNSRFQGPNPLPLAQVMDLHASKTLRMGS